MTKLKDVFSKQITGEWGTEPSSKDSVYVLRTTNFTNEGIIDYSNVVQRDIPISKVKDKQLYKDDIILEKSGGSDNIPVGRVVYCGDEIEQKTYLCNNFTQAMRVNTDIAVPKYIFHYMMYLHKTGRTSLLQRKTTGIRNLQLKGYLNLDIPFPSKSTQLNIANTLDKIDSLTKLNKQRLILMDNLVKSRFIEMFGDIYLNSKNYSKYDLGDICYKITDGKHGGCERNIGSGFYYVGAREIYNNKINYSTAIEITKKDFEKDYTRCDLRNGDFIIVNTGATIGKSAIVNTPLAKRTLLQKSVALIRTNKSFILPDYLQYCYILNSELYRVKNSSAQANLLLSRIKKTLIPVPPIQLQERFSSVINRVDKSKVEIQKSLGKLETLKKSLMQEYFS